MSRESHRDGELRERKTFPPSEGGKRGIFRTDSPENKVYSREIFTRKYARSISLSPSVARARAERSSFILVFFANTFQARFHGKCFPPPFIYRKCFLAGGIYERHNICYHVSYCSIGVSPRDSPFGQADKQRLKYTQRPIARPR